MTPWRPCYRSARWLCVRCWVREVTGVNRRALADHLVRSQEMAATVPPLYVWRDTEGTLQRSSTKPDGWRARGEATR